MRNLLGPPQIQYGICMAPPPPVFRPPPTLFKWTLPYDVQYEKLSTSGTEASRLSSLRLFSRRARSLVYFTCLCLYYVDLYGYFSHFFYYCNVSPRSDVDMQMLVGRKCYDQGYIAAAVHWIILTLMWLMYYSQCTKMRTLHYHLSITWHMYVAGNIVWLMWNTIILLYVFISIQSDFREFYSIQVA